VINIDTTSTQPFRLVRGCTLSEQKKLYDDASPVRVDQGPVDASEDCNSIVSLGVFRVGAPGRVLCSSSAAILLSCGVGNILALQVQRLACALPNQPCAAVTVISRM
jgi:hypothetical protein